MGPTQVENGSCLDYLDYWHHLLVGISFLYDNTLSRWYNWHFHAIIHLVGQKWPANRSGDCFLLKINDFIAHLVGFQQDHGFCVDKMAINMYLHSIYIITCHHKIVQPKWIPADSIKRILCACNCFSTWLMAKQCYPHAFRSVCITKLFRRVF